MNVKKLIELLKKEDPDAQVYLREPYDDAAEYTLNHVLRRHPEQPGPVDWEVVLTP